MSETDRIELGLSGSDRWVVLLGFPVAGAVLGAVLPWVWRLVDDIDWIPFRGPLSTLMSLDHGWQSAARIAIVAAAALVLAVVVVNDEVRVLVGPDDVLVRRSGATRVIRRDQVAGVHHDGKKLVIESREGRRLLEAKVENARSGAGPAFNRFGYPWENLE